MNFFPSQTLFFEEFPSFEVRGNKLYSACIFYRRHRHKAPAAVGFSAQTLNSIAQLSLSKKFPATKISLSRFGILFERLKKKFYWVGKKRRRRFFFDEQSFPFSPREWKFSISIRKFRSRSVFLFVFYTAERGWQRGDSSSQSGQTKIQSLSLSCPGPSRSLFSSIDIGFWPVLVTFFPNIKYTHIEKAERVSFEPAADRERPGKREAAKINIIDQPRCQFREFQNLSGFPLSLSSLLTTSST